MIHMVRERHMYVLLPFNSIREKELVEVEMEKLVEVEMEKKRKEKKREEKKRKEKRNT